VWAWLKHTPGQRLSPVPSQPQNPPYPFSSQFEAREKLFLYESEQGKKQYMDSAVVGTETA